MKLQHIDYTLSISRGVTILTLKVIAGLTNLLVFLLSTNAKKKMNEDTSKLQHSLPLASFRDTKATGLVRDDEVTNRTEKSSC